MGEEFRNPASTVDVIVEKENKILLIKRKGEPYKGYWALPGGFIDYGKENLEQAATRELKEETGLVARGLELLKVYSDPGRDPRGHIVSHVYVAGEVSGRVAAGDDACEAGFFKIDDLPYLAFDHKRILRDYIKFKEEK